MSNLLACGLLVGAVAAVSAIADDTPPFKITTERENDRVDVKVETDKAIFSLRSPIGISHALIERVDEKWPDAVVLRLHLKGLENFLVTDGKVKLAGSASLQVGQPLVRLWKDGNEDKPLDARSPYWMDVPKEIPIKDGYFEMALPKAFLEGNPNSITVNWINFYRN